MEREFERGIPKIDVRGNDRNQPWASVIDNAIEAAIDDRRPNGTLRQRTRHGDGEGDAGGVTGVVAGGVVDDVGDDSPRTPIDAEGATPPG